MNPLTVPVMVVIESLLFLYKDGLGVKFPTKVDMSLNKETKTLY